MVSAQKRWLDEMFLVLGARALRQIKLDDATGNVELSLMRLAIEDEDRA